jgi:uncharacterized protein (DUF1697 family)
MVAQQTYVALFRGINVLGRNVLPMKELAKVLEHAGCCDVRTYIQSGNAIFRCAAVDAARMASRIAAGVSEARGFAPRVLLLKRAELARAAAANPFPQAETNPTSVHLFFLAEKPQRPDVKAIEALRATSERFALKGKVFYLYTPDGFGPSKLASRAERFLGVDATARNWRTVTRLIEMSRL